MLPIKKAGYIHGTPHFHGIGLAIEEPFGSFPVQPEYKPNVSLVIEAGTVIEFEPNAVSPDGKRGVHN